MAAMLAMHLRGMSHIHLELRLCSNDHQDPDMVTISPLVNVQPVKPNLRSTILLQALFFLLTTSLAATVKSPLVCPLFFGLDLST